MRKRSNKINKHNISPEEALRFLEDIRLMSFELDEPTKAISIRVPENILRALKTKAKTEKRKYQSLIIEILRDAVAPQKIRSGRSRN